MNSIGEQVQKRWLEIAEKHDIKIKVSGIYPLSHFEFEYENSLAYKTYFTQEMLSKGFLAATGFYMSYAHTQDILDKYFEAFEQVMMQIQEIHSKSESVEDYIDEICHAGFERLN